MRSKERGIQLGISLFIRSETCLTKYIDKAMSKAVYDKLEDGSFSGKIPQCPGLIAFEESLYRCEQELRYSLEG